MKQILAALVLSSVSVPLISDSEIHKKGEEFKGYVVKKKSSSGYRCEHSTLPEGTVVQITATPPEKPEVKEVTVAKPISGGSGKLESKYGNRRCRGCSRFHKGVDFHGKHVVAALDGIVSKVGWGGGFGRLVVLDHKGPDGKTKKTTLYGHMKRCKVKHGQKVKKGQILGDVGSTGRSTGKHLHFEMSNNRQGGYDGHTSGKKENPLPYIQGKKKVKVAVVEPPKITTCTIVGSSHYGDNILAVPETVAKKVGMDDEKVKEVAVKVMILPQG